MDKAVGFLYDICKDVAKDNISQEHQHIYDQITSSNNVKSIMKQTVKYHNIANQYKESIDLRTNLIKNQLPGYIMAMNEHDVHYLLDQWMYMD